MATFKDSARGLAGILWRGLPEGVRRRLLRELILAQAGGDARVALGRLFALADDLEEALGQSATRYEGGIHPKHRLMAYHAFFVDRIRDGERVADIGCGYGAVAYSIVTGREVDVLGIDDQPGNIAMARVRHVHPRLEFRVGRAPDDLPDERFDAVVLSNVLEHVEDRPALLGALRRRLGPRRYLIRLPLYDRSWTVPLRCELGLAYFCDPTHTAELTAEGWVAEVEGAGLRVGHRQTRWGELWCEALDPGPEG